LEGREAIRVPNQTFSELRLETHPDKTFVGCIEKGGDFLGYHFSSDGFEWLERR
jgi:RNA-directed DNA polymerase